MVAWPSTLPQNCLVGDFSEKLPDLVLKSKTDTGPGKRRRRATAGVGMITMVILVTQAQWETLIEFHHTDLMDGALTFTHAHPISGAPLTLAFTRPPERTPATHNLFRVANEFEVYP